MPCYPSFDRYDNNFPFIQMPDEGPVRFWSINVDLTELSFKDILENFSALKFT